MWSHMLSLFHIQGGKHDICPPPPPPPPYQLGLPVKGSAALIGGCCPQVVSASFHFSLSSTWTSLLSSSAAVNLKMDKRVIYVHRGTKGDLLCEVVAPSQTFTWSCQNWEQSWGPPAPAAAHKEGRKLIMYNAAWRDELRLLPPPVSFSSSLAAAPHISHSLKHMTCIDLQQVLHSDSCSLPFCADRTVCASVCIHCWEALIKGRVWNMTKRSGESLPVCIGFICCEFVLMQI